MMTAAAPVPRDAAARKRPNGCSLDVGPSVSRERSAKKASPAAARLHADQRNARIVGQATRAGRRRTRPLAPPAGNSRPPAKPSAGSLARRLGNPDDVFFRSVHEVLHPRPRERSASAGSRCPTSAALAWRPCAPAREVAQSATQLPASRLWHRCRVTRICLLSNA